MTRRLTTIRSASSQVIYLLDYTQPELSTLDISDLTARFIAAKTEKDTQTMEKLETTIIVRMEQETLRTKYYPVEHVLGTLGLSDKIMIRALELYSSQINFLNNALEIINNENSNEVKKTVLYMLAKKAYLHTLEEMQQKRTFRGNKSLETILGYAIKKCVKVCFDKGHSATLGHSLGYRKLRLATCSG